MSYADLILSGGPIFRGLREGFAQALAVHGERIVACGDRIAVEAFAGPATRRVDLGGRVAIPAFNDAHQHLLPMGLGMLHVNLRAEQVRTLDALLGASARRRWRRRKAPGYSAAAMITARWMSTGIRPWTS